MPKRLPSVSVCIEARGDASTLMETLARVLASHYPKLEVIVLDNGFMEMNPVNVRVFAARGVRFIEGSDVLSGDMALETMKLHASGAYVFHIDADTWIEPDTISHLVRESTQPEAMNVAWFSHRELLEES